MTQTSELYRLQEIDGTWDKVRRRLLKLQQITSTNQAVERAQQKVDEAEAELSQWQGTQKNAELESRSLVKRIQESEERLMSGQVRNPKELEALQASIESMKRQRQTVDDQAVEALLHVEETTKEVAQAEETLATLQKKWQEQQKSMEAEMLQRKKEFVYLKKLREKVVAQMDDQLLSQYDQLRKRKNGVAVAKMENGVCSACNISVPTGVASAVRSREEMTLCPGCGRILHVSS